MRLDRYIAECGLGTRSEIRAHIKKGKARVNGSIITNPAASVEPVNDIVQFEGRELTYEKFRYYMLNKPQGCVSATRDGLSETVLDMLDGENTRGLFPVGRLDKDTEGLLLITNDGQLAHRLLSPAKHVDKTYIATVSRALGENEMDAFRRGLDIGDDEPTLEAGIERIEEETSLAEECDGACKEVYEAAYRVTIHEGRYHQIKRMFEALGSEVLFLKRVSMGPLSLDDYLQPGEYRRLTEEETAALQ